MPDNSGNIAGDAAITIIAIATVVVSCQIIIFYKVVKRFMCEPKHKGRPTSSLSSSAVNVETARGLSSVVPVIANTFHDTNETNGRVGRESILEMPVGLSSEQELVPRQILTNLTFDQIAYIKSCCQQSHLIGKGSYGRVYRGRFRDKDLAIKKIEHRRPDEKKWQESEVKLLQGKDHININKLYAWYIETDISYLAYMYIDGCSLTDYIGGKCMRFTNSWKQSFKMIMGIAKGIEFLHQKKIIHVDIKPQNIMVDANDNEAKLVDFGFSRHVDWEGTHRITDNIIGTQGYWAPEYCLRSKLSYKHDVYSFGIVVLEMITGQRHVDTARGSSQFHIPNYVGRMIENNRFEEAVDTKLKRNGWDNIALEEALAVANMALRCVQEERAERPDMTRAHRTHFFD